MTIKVVTIFGNTLIIGPSGIEIEMRILSGYILIVLIIGPSGIEILSRLHYLHRR